MEKACERIPTNKSGIPVVWRAGEEVDCEACLASAALSNDAANGDVIWGIAPIAKEGAIILPSNKGEGGGVLGPEKADQAVAEALAQLDKRSEIRRACGVVDEPIKLGVDEAADFQLELMEGLDLAFCGDVVAEGR